MRILVNDGMSKEGIDLLREAGHIVEDNKIPQEELAAKIGDYEALVVRSATKVTREVIDAAVNLKAIVRGGVGLDNIDLARAKALNIKVMNTPSASSASVAELALAHMFALSRFIHSANLSMRQGKWEKKQYRGVELGGKTLGILGIGRIGYELAKRAIGLEMKVIAHDPYVDSIDINVMLESKDNLLTNSDYISLHMPTQADGSPVISTEDFRKMKNSAYLINCARGGVVDEKALLEALNTGQIAGAGVDVYVGEPNPMPELVNHPFVSVTPHIGASTVEAQKRVGADVAQQLIEFAKGW